MKPTKVIQINSECGRGSTGKIAVSISKLLEQHGIENKVFYSGNHKSDYPNGVMISGKLSIRIHQLLSRIFGDQGFHSSFSTLRLIRKIKKMQPDVILLHNIHGYYINLSILFKFLKRYGRPVYWVLHDCWSFTGHCTHFTIAGCDKWKTGCFACPQKDKYPYSWFFDRSRYLYKKKKELFTSLSDLTIITPSQWLAEKVKDSFLGKYPIKVINNGIDLDVFKPTESDFREKHGLCDKKIILGVASVWSYAKGLDVFVELAQRLDEDKYKIVLVGTDEKTDASLPGNILSIHRTQNQKELAQIYSAADVFVNSTREENYPTVNMEAIACGTPVITFNTGGCAEIVGSGCGEIIRTDSADEAEQKITEQIQNNRQTTNDCLSWSKRFDDKRCFEEYVKLICR